MSIVIKQTDVNGYHICCEAESLYNLVYKVTVCPKYEDSLCGYPIRQTTYTDSKKALATYRRYVKEFSK